VTYGKEPMTTGSKSDLDCNTESRINRAELADYNSSVFKVWD